MPLYFLLVNLSTRPRSATLDLGRIPSIGSATASQLEGRSTSSRARGVSIQLTQIRVFPRDNEVLDARWLWKRKLARSAATHATADYIRGDLNRYWIRYRGRPRATRKRLCRVDHAFIPRCIRFPAAGSGRFATKRFTSAARAHGTSILADAGYRCLRQTASARFSRRIKAHERMARPRALRDH